MEYELRKKKIVETKEEYHGEESVKVSCSYEYFPFLKEGEKTPIKKIVVKTRTPLDIEEDDRQEFSL